MRAKMAQARRIVEDNREIFEKREKELVLIVEKYAPVTSPQLWDIIVNNKELADLSKSMYKRLLKSARKKRLLFWVKNPLFAGAFFHTFKHSIVPTNPDLCPNFAVLEPLLDKLERKKKAAEQKKLSLEEKRKITLDLID